MTIVNTVHHKGCSFSIPECVETILRTRTSGVLGEYVVLDPVACGMDTRMQEHARVTAGGRTFIAYREPLGGPWHILFQDVAGVDMSAEHATRLALSMGEDGIPDYEPDGRLFESEHAVTARPGRVSRNYPINGVA